MDLLLDYQIGKLTTSIHHAITACEHAIRMYEAFLIPPTYTPGFNNTVEVVMNSSRDNPLFHQYDNNNNQNQNNRFNKLMRSCNKSIYGNLVDCDKFVMIRNRRKCALDTAEIYINNSLSMMADICSGIQYFLFIASTVYDLLFNHIS